MDAGDLIELLTQSDLLDPSDVLDMTVRELYLMLDYLSGVRPPAHRPIG
jgi:hypothetical protein